MVITMPSFRLKRQAMNITEIYGPEQNNSLRRGSIYMSWLMQIYGIFNPNKPDKGRKHTNANRMSQIVWIQLFLQISTNIKSDLIEFLTQEITRPPMQSMQRPPSLSRA